MTYTAHVVIPRMHPSGDTHLIDLVNDTPHIGGCAYSHGVADITQGAADITTTAVDTSQGAANEYHLKGGG